MGTSTSRLTRAQWFEHVKNWRSSHLSAREYAAKHELGVASLYGWAGCFKRESNQQSLVRVHAVAATVAPLAPEPGAIHIRWPNGVTLTMDRTVEHSILENILRIVGSAPC